MCRRGASKTSDTQGLSLTITHRNSQLWQYKLETMDTWFCMQNMGLVGHIPLRTDVFPLLHSWSGECYSSFCRVTGASSGNDLIHHYYQKKGMWLSRLCLACSQHHNYDPLHLFMCLRLSYTVHLTREIGVSDCLTQLEYTDDVWNMIDDGDDEGFIFFKPPK